MSEEKTFTAGRVAEGGPVSRRELDRLRERRESPAPVLDYRLGEPTGNVMRKLDVIRARRAHHISARLHDIEGRAENDFSLAGMSGRAKCDFERC